MRKKPLLFKTACFLVCQTAALLLTCSLGASAEVIREDEPKIAKDIKQPVYHWVDKEKPLHGLIVAIHGATLHGGAFDPMARKLAEQGYETYAPDLRGFGRWVADQGKTVPDGEIAFYRSREDIVGLILALTGAIFYYYSSILITTPCPRLQLPTGYNRDRCRDMITACKKGGIGDPVALWSPHSTRSPRGRHGPWAQRPSASSVLRP
ncbi:MAG TPA: alpha/beta hydrolase, partial [Candidatus Melainabacteria bacterium]|nr:alpha/beta hydrolase [Candidatus Melainabacteria bacterium]